MDDLLAEFEQPKERTQEAKERRRRLVATAAIVGLTETLAMELGPFGVRANSICPGAVEGPRIEAVLAREAALKSTTRDAIYRGYAAGTSMRSFVTATDVAALAVFLASEGARFVSGQIMAVDGHTENPDPKV